MPAIDASSFLRERQNVAAKLKVEAEKQMNRKMSVLVVDDNEASAKTLGWMVEMMGHDIHLAHDSKSALEIGEKIMPQVVLMDIGLPGMNGYELCRLMHENDIFKKSIFIAQTGWGQPEHRKRSNEAGFNHHLVKPIMMDVLENLLNEIILSSPPDKAAS